MLFSSARRFPRAWATAVAASAAFSCSPPAPSSGGPPAAAVTCPMVFPSACPSPSPSWVADVQPIVEERCYPCHGPGGVEQSVLDFTNYQGFNMAKTTVDVEIYHCAMPPPDAGAATPEEQLTVLTWIVCGAPNN